MRHTKSQLRKLTETLESNNPSRADVELLDDGTLYIALYGEEVRRPYCLRRWDRRGSILRQACRSATGWTSFTGPSGDRPPTRGDDEAVRDWVRHA